MKPVKPKMMPKRQNQFLRSAANGDTGFNHIDARDARAILAALEYERQRADRAEDVALDALRSAHGIPEVPYSERHQREQTAAVVPKPKAKRRG